MRGVQKFSEGIGSKSNTTATRTTPVRSSGSSRNSSPTVSNAANAVDIATGITKGYKPVGTYNDAGMRAMGNGTIDPITQYKLQYEAAKARGDQSGMDQAHNLAEQYRAQFNYSGGLDGSENIGVTPTEIQPLLQQAQQAQQQVQPFQMPEAFAYTPFEESELGKLALQGYQGHLKELENYPDFTYDPFKDPLYQQYAEAYTRGGQRAMQDTMGQIAARTGGLASSYAGQVGQQTYDQYMEDLANKIPELRQIAYNMYSDDYNRQLGLYDRGYDRYSDDYNRYIDQARFGYQRYGDDRDLAYQVWRAQVGDQQWQNQFDWTRSTDARDYARNVYTDDRNFDYTKSTDERNFNYQKEQDAWNRQLQERQYQDSLKAELRDRVDRYGYMPTQQDAETYGLTAAELLSLQEQARHVRAADASKYYSGW